MSFSSYYCYHNLEQIKILSVFLSLHQESKVNQLSALYNLIISFIAAAGTREVLEFLDEYKEGQYKDFLHSASCHMLNVRLRQLLKFDLIEYHVTRSVKKREWYTITKRGKKIVHHLKEMEEIICEHLREHSSESAVKVNW